MGMLRFRKWIMMKDRGGKRGWRGKKRGGRNRNEKWSGWVMGVRKEVNGGEK